jgi:hypothetical protein
MAADGGFELSLAVEQTELLIRELSQLIDNDRSEDDFGLKPKLTYARGSVEWEAEQRRLKNNAAPE